MLMALSGFKCTFSVNAVQLNALNSQDLEVVQDLTLLTLVNTGQFFLYLTLNYML